MNKPQVGDKLYLVEAGHRGADSGECTVTKVGRLYFEVHSETVYIRETRFKLDDWRQKTEYSVTYRLYQNEQTYRDQIEAHKWADLYRVTFGSHSRAKFTLDQYRQASKILGIEIPGGGD